MGSKVEACAKCTQKCSRIHKNRKISTALSSSFFKIMMGDQFATVLSFPPKLAPMVSSLVGQETFLEDTRGQRWKVKVSILKDSVVLQQGWNAFASYHGLQLGDFLVFNYIIGSHFEVNIYGKDACEKLDFPVSRNQRKQAETNARNFSAQDGPCLAVDKGATNSNGPIAAVPPDVEICQSRSKVRKDVKNVLVTEASVPCGVEIGQGRSKVKNDVEKVHQVTQTTSINKKNRTRPLKAVPKANHIEEDDCILTGDFRDTEDEYQRTEIDMSNLNLAKNISGKRKKKRILTRDSGDKEDEYQIIGSGMCSLELMKNTSGKRGRKKILVGDSRDKEDEYQRTAVDLTNLELTKNISSKRGRKKIMIGETKCPRHAPTSFTSQNEAGLSNRESLDKGLRSALVSSGVLDFEKGEWRSDSDKGDNLVAVSDKKSGHNKITEALLWSKSPWQMPKGSENSYDLSNGALKECEAAEGTDKGQSKEEPEVIKLKQHGSPESPTRGSDKGSGETILATPDVYRSPKSPIGGSDKASGAMIISTPDVDAHPLTMAANISCLIGSNSQPYLKLPKPLPSLPTRHKRERKIFFLRDPDMRAWPVLYKESSKPTTLKSGWEAFSKANLLQPGDQCVFEVEDLDEEIFRVSIVRDRHV